MPYQDEKAEEKQEEKRLEKEQEEKVWDEKDWRRDALSGTIWALILIWAGALLLVIQLNLSFFGWLDWGNAWGAIMIGAALLLGLEVAIRLMNPSYAKPLRGRMILAVILAIVGIGNFTDVELWPLVLIALGLAILFGGFRRPR